MGNHENIPFLVLAGGAAIVLISQIVNLRSNPRRRKDGYLTAIIWGGVAAIFVTAGVQSNSNLATLVGGLATAITCVSYVGTKRAYNRKSR